MEAKKTKLLQKYLSQPKITKQYHNNHHLLLKDHDLIQQQEVHSSSQSEERPRKRVRSQSQGSEQQKIKIQQDLQGKKSKRINKGLRKALGLKKGEDIDEFLKEIKIEGVQIHQLEHYLKQNKIGLVMQSKKQRKQKKRKEKQLEQHIKIQNKQQSSSDSDIIIPQKARTIYRNKDGTIRQFSLKKQKQLKKQKVLQRLGQWQKGMKNIQQQSDEDKVDIWDDPLRRWQKQVKNPFKCPYQGYANRFNIKPGHRWDGVIRGNGFQNKWLQQQNLKKMKQQKQHKDYLKNL